MRRRPCLDRGVCHRRATRFEERFEPRVVDPTERPPVYTLTQNVDYFDHST